MKVIYAKGSEGVQFNKIAEEATRKAFEEGHVKLVTKLKNNLVRVEHIKKPVDIYHCHSAHSLQGIRKAKKLGAKTILQRDSCHVLDMIKWCEEGNKIWNKKYPQCCSNLRARTNLDFQLSEYEEADHILLASKLEVESFKNHGFKKKKLKRIPFSVDHDYFKPFKKPKSFSIVLGGGCSVRKGYPEAKEACEKVGTMLNVVPSNPKGSRFVREELNKHHVMLAPTREDGFPCLVQEGMSCGLVPVVSNRNGVKDLIKNGINGYVINIDRDVNDFIKEIVEVLELLKNDDKLVKELSVKAREAVTKNSWEKYGINVLKFYKKIMRC